MSRLHKIYKRCSVCVFVMLFKNIWQKTKTKKQKSTAYTFMDAENGYELNIDDKQVCRF